MYFCVVLCIVCFVPFSVLFVCICVLHYCHRVAIQLQLNISYHIIFRGMLKPSIPEAAEANQLRCNVIIFE
jgi:hypothetical protein